MEQKNSSLIILLEIYEAYIAERHMENERKFGM